MPFGISAGVSGLFNTYSARQAQKHQEKMYKHRYQWQVADMRKAGINPMLSIMQGAPGVGASPQAAPIDTSKSFSAGSLQRALSKTQETEQQKNIAAADASNAQAEAAREQARIYRSEAYKNEKALQHWDEPAMGVQLSTAKAMSDAGMHSVIGTAGGVVGGMADASRRVLESGIEKIGKWRDRYNDRRLREQQRSDKGKPATSAKEVSRRPVNSGLTGKDPRKGSRPAR